MSVRRPLVHYGAVALAAAAVLAAAACGGRAPSSGGTQAGDGQTARGEKGTLTVGLLNPSTGPYAALGEDVNAAFELYLDSKGGVLSGYGIRTVKEDTANDQGQATTKTRQLVEQNDAQIVVGLVNSGVAYAVAPYLEDAGVPLLITVAGADGLTRTKDSNVFRVSYTSSQDSMPAGDYACEELGHQTAAVVGLDYAFGWEAAGGFARAYEDAGCTVVQELYAPLATQDWSPYVNQIDRDADMVFAVIPGSDAIRFFKAYRGFGLETPVVAHGSTTDEQLLPSLAGTADGTVTTLHYTPRLDNPVNERFVAAWEEAYDRSANQYAEDGYAAAMVLEAALAELSGEPTAEALQEALRGVSLETPRGPLEFDEYGQAVYNIYVRKVEQRDGQWVNSVVDTIEDVGQFWRYQPEEYLDLPPYEELKGSWAN